MALTKVGPAGIGSTPGIGITIGNSFLHTTGLESTNANFSGIVTAQTFRVLGNFQVDGTTTTLDTEITSVDKLEVEANNTTVAVAITQSGTGDILNLYDGSNEVFSIADGGKVTGVGSITAASFHGDGSQLTGIDATQIQTGNTSVQTVDTGSDGHVKINTEGSERLRVTPDGDIEIGPQNGIGCTITAAGAIRAKSIIKGVSDSGLYAQAVASGQQFSFRAADNSSNNNAVIYSDGSGYFLSDVGIGTANPVGNLEVRDTKANLIVAKDGLTVKSNSDIASQYDLIQLGAGGALASYSTATATADTQFIHNAYRHSGGQWKYRYADTAMRFRMNSPGNTFIFESAASGNADADITFTQRLRLDANGHMGLGVTPSAWAANGDFRGLQVGGASLFGRGSGDEDRGGIAVNYYHTGSAEKYIANGNAARIYLADGSIYFSNAAANSSGAGAAMTLTERLRIDSDGKIVTKGGTAVGALTLAGDGEDITFGRTQNSGTGGVGRLVATGNLVYIQAGANTSSGSAADLIFCAYGGVGEKMRISSTGRVMIGTTTEGQANADEFTISFNNTGVPDGDKGRCGMTIRSGSNTSSVEQDGYIYFSNGTSGDNEYKGTIVYEHDNDALKFGTNGGYERLCIDGGGRVSLHGLTASSYYSTYNSFVLGKTNDSAGMTIVSKNDSSGYIVFADGTSGDERYAGRFSYDHNVNSFKFDTNGGTNRLTIDSNGSVLVNTAGQSTQYSYSMKLGQGTYSNNDSTPPHYGLWVRQNGPRYALNYGIFSEVVGDIGYYGGSTLDGLTTVRGIGVYGVAKSTANAYQKGIGVYGKATNTTSNYNTSIGVRGRAEIGTTTFSNNNGQKSYGGHFVSTGKADCVGVYADAYLDGSPGAGQEAIPLLVSSNGTEKLRVDATQNALILSHNNALTLKYNTSTQKDLSYAATRYIYISDSGDDTTGSGTSASPWRTMSKALASVPKLLIWNCYVIMKGSSFTDGTGGNTLEGICGWGKVIITSETGTVTYNKTKQFVVYDCHARIEFQNIDFICPTGGTGFALERNHYIDFKSGCSYEFQGQGGWSWQAGVYAIHNDRMIVSCNTTCTNNSTSGLGGVWYFDNCRAVSFSGDLTKNGTQFNNHGISCVNGTWIYLSGDITNFVRGLALGANHYGNESRADAVIAGTTISNCGTGVQLYNGSLLKNYSSTFSNNSNTNIDLGGDGILT